MTHWREYARCLEVDPDTFYPEDEEEGAGPALAICGACAVRMQCLEHAIAHREKEGIWGGATSRERRRIIRRRRRSA